MGPSVVPIIRGDLGPQVTLAMFSIQSSQQEQLQSLEFNWAEVKDTLTAFNTQNAPHLSVRSANNSAEVRELCSAFRTFGRKASGVGIFSGHGVK